MIRPEAARTLHRWREALAGAALVLLGLYWVFGVGGLLYWIGFAVACAGAALVVAGFQRARFRSGGGGPGVVTVVEGRIGYFGPLSGGLADLEDLTQLVLDPTSYPPHWQLHRAGQPLLAIPLNAEGADQLFDAFASLPGMRTERMLREMQNAGAAPVVIWRAEHVRQTTLRLH
ncbi:hypothetical protein [Aestuariicoccus sp. MJ-SS9]|uniref:hypothetical protein n=1 Tax=Aestuariicoccus sp. MJ-SS9 TaxID=3079855 RepID=UPI002913A542|nr:hypothetical protein [Aestuariicoccus sp. MJ-SS9]MDU8913658.1 hypothetical protein [Aestuariicoccus sp. MJ-SS9]